MFRLSLASMVIASAEMSWEEFKMKYGKVYNGNDEATRQLKYEANVQTIEEHNAKNETWTKAVNFFADLTREEWLALVAGPPKEPHWAGEWHDFADEESLRSSVDWVEEGVVNPIMDQGNSESCWAHSAAASLESIYAIKTRNLVKLSEQQLCECSGAGSCKEGGYENDAIDWYAGHDACTRQSYPFTGKDRKCKSDCTVAVPGDFITGAIRFKGTVKAFKSALNSQPFSIAICSSDLDQFYGDGVLKVGCSGCTDHAVNAVGYGEMQGTPYFKIRNSWGESWGAHGYLYIEQDNGHKGGAACIFKYPAAYPQIRHGSLPLSADEVAV